MELTTVLVGIIIGLVLILVSPNLRKKQQPRLASASAMPAVPEPIAYPAPPRTLRPIQAQGPRNLQVVDQRVSTRTLLQTWKNSVMGLIGLAQRNLAYADRCLETGAFGAAVDAAVTSMENISRALLHCYGEKPEQNSGQEEALRLLARRFKGNEDLEFQKALEECCKVYANNIVRKYLATRKLDSSFLFAKPRTALIVQSASKVAEVFSRLIDEHFATEIPELRERCPKCLSMNTGVWGFDKTSVVYVCNRCRYSWTDQRNH
jgi:uncharacterized protein (UPF0332 family)